MAGSFGVLAIMTSTLKTTCRKSRTVLVFGANDEHARALMSKALGRFRGLRRGSYPGAIGGNSGVDHVANAAAASPPFGSRIGAVRGIPLSVLEGPFGRPLGGRGRAPRRLWTEIRDAAMLPVGDDRTMAGFVAPTDGPGLVAKIASTFQTDASTTGAADWSGSPSSAISPPRPRPSARPSCRGSHATLIRGARTCNGADVPPFIRPRRPCGPCNSG